MTEEKNIDQKTEEITEEGKFKGKYLNAIGRRKTAVARVRLYLNGKGAIIVNNMPPKKYFAADDASQLANPLKLTGLLRDFEISIIVKGGGKKAQLDAARHGIARALVAYDKELRKPIKVKGYLTRDSRKKERKKPGLKRARRAPQWSKR